MTGQKAWNANSIFSDDTAFNSRLEWLLICPKHFEIANKNAKIYAGWSRTVINLTFCDHTQCVNCITEMLLSVNNYRTRVLCLAKPKNEK